MSDRAWVYIKSEPGLWTVGFYKPNGKWEPESDHANKDDADSRVHYLNGEENERLTAEVERLRAALHKIGFEPLGHTDSTDWEAFECAVQIARAALSPTKENPHDHPR